MREPTEQDQAEQAGRGGGEQFRTTFEQAAVGVAHVGPDGRWRRVNPKLRDMRGYGPDEMAGLRVRDLTHPTNLDADLADARRLLAGEVMAYSAQKRYVRK